MNWVMNGDHGAKTTCGKFRISINVVMGKKFYVPFVAEQCEDYRGKPVTRWFPISGPFRDKEKAKRECEQWTQNNEKK